MYYRHNLNYQYPEKSDAHMITVKHLRDTHFDVTYPYYPKSPWYKLCRGIYWLGVTLIVFPLLHLTHGLRIYGKKNLKKHKKDLKNGAITISNHVFYWDFLCVLKAIRPRLTFFPAWKTNFEGPLRACIRLSGGIPIPTDNIHAMGKFNLAINQVLEDGRWLHVFPEGSMWFYYPDIRPFKKAVFSYAVKHNKPIVPISLSFRPRRGIMKLLGKTPLVDLHVGEPLYPDTSLPRAEAERDLHRRAYHIMQVMNGINPDDPTYQDDPFTTDYKKTM